MASYSQTTTNSITIVAADLALDPSTFTPTAESLSLLLAELNSDITSSGEAVSFSYSSEDNAIVGVNGSGDVLRIDIVAATDGENVTLELTTTVLQPVDHVPSVGGGLVSYIDDQINIAFEIQGQDTAGNLLQSPVEIEVVLLDGADPTILEATFQSGDDNLASVEGQLVQLGSDNLQSVILSDGVTSQFEDLFSDNQSLKATLSADQTQLVVTQAESGEQVMTLSVNVDGSYQFQQFRSVEQNGVEEVTLSFPTIITDYDFDVVNNTIQVTIEDGAIPIITQVDSLNLDETGLTGGTEEGVAVVSDTGSITAQQGSDIIDHFELEPNEFNQDGTLLSSDQIVQLELVSDTGGVLRYQGFIEVDGSKQTVFNVALDTPTLGEYEFTLLKPLEHKGLEDEQLTISLPVYAVDSDGDRSTITGEQDATAVQINIVVQDDDHQLAGESFSLTEPTVVGTETVSHNIFTSQGADGSNITSFTYGGVSFTLNTNLDADAAQSFEFDEGVLTISRDGAFGFDVARDIDHSVSETITKDIVFTAVDGDDDTDTVQISLAITDGDRPSITTITSVEFDEANLANGSDLDLTVTSLTKSIVYQEGSDDIHFFAVDVTEFNTDGTLKADGLAVEMREDPSDSGRYVGFTTDGDIADNDSETTIFTFVFNQFGVEDSTDKGNYTFTLLKPFDHPEGLETNDVTFSLLIYAQDTDRDPTLLTPLNVTVTDDIPTIGDLTDQSDVDVQESDIGMTGAEATGAFVTTEGADGVVKYELANDDTATDGFLAGGFPITISEVMNVSGATQYQGLSNGQVVFTLTLSDNGQYTFNLSQPIDHINDVDSLSIPFEVIAIDADGDPSDNFDLAIEIVDDKPTLTNYQGDTLVDEHNLDGQGSEQTEDTAVDGTFVLEEGADGVVQYTLANEATVLQNLRSGGETLSWGTPSVNGEVITYTAQTASGSTVFTLTLNASNNTYDFTLLGVLDHPVANSGADGEDDIQINFSITATDYDGDETLPMTLPIKVRDDVPMLTERNISRVEGDGFSTQISMFDVTTDQGADGAKVTLIEGTTEGSSTILFGGANATYVASTAIQEGSQDVLVFEEIDLGNGAKEVRELGTLRIDSNGDVQFNANANLAHGNSDITFAINVTATDGDLDTSTKPLNFAISTVPFLSSPK